MLENTSIGSVIAENAAVFAERVERAEQQSEISAVQLVRLMSPYGDADEAYSKFREIFKSASGRTNAAFCRAVCAEPSYLSSISDKKLFGNGDEPLPGTHGRIAYVRSKRNERAFSVLSAKIRSARGYSCSSFSEACEAVYNGVCELCMLPIENSTDGKLYPFYGMMDRYGLVIRDVADVNAEEGAEAVRYALVGRYAELRRVKHIKCGFELAVVCEDGVLPCDIIEVTRALGGKILNIGAQPVQYDDEGTKYYFFTELTDADAIALALYVSLEHPRYTPLGLYEMKN